MGIIIAALAAFAVGQGPIGNPSTPKAIVSIVPWDVEPKMDAIISPGLVEVQETGSIVGTITVTDKDKIRCTYDDRTVEDKIITGGQVRIVGTIESGREAGVAMNGQVNDTLTFTHLVIAKDTGGEDYIVRADRFNVIDDGTLLNGGLLLKDETRELVRLVRINKKN